MIQKQTLLKSPLPIPGKPGRKPLPKDLPGEQIRYELPKSEQVCGCGHALHEIGEDLSAAAAVSLASPT